jgi:xylulokinase
LPPTPIFSLNKLLWLRDHEPDVLARMVRWLCVSDYIAFRLTGEQAMGYSLASRTMAFDLAHRAWSEALLAYAGLRPNHLPPPVPEGTRVGRVKTPGETGLPEGLLVFVGGHDHVCGALAVGAFEPGVVLDSTGTTEAELVVLPEVRAHLEAGDLSFSLGCHTARDRYYAIGSILGAGGLMGWVANLLWPREAAEGRQAALEALTHAAAESPIGANGLYLLPHLSGAGAPQRDPAARGVLAGLHLGHTRGDIARAAIEGMAIELRLLLETLAAYTGQAIARVVAVGGGARNPLWTQIKADVTGYAIAVPAHTEAVALGAAILAGIGAGVFRDERHAYAAMAPPSHPVPPDPERHRAYSALYRRVMAVVRPVGAVVGRRHWMALG